MIVVRIRALSKVLYANSIALAIVPSWGDSYWSLLALRCRPRATREERPPSSSAGMMDGRGINKRSEAVEANITDNSQNHSQGPINCQQGIANME